MATGVVLVAFNSGPLLQDCVQSVLASHGADLRILVVDNGSTDDTLERFLASDPGASASRHSRQPDTIAPGHVAVWQLEHNYGFAGGVNHGVRAFMAMEDVDYIWILNPDAQAQPQTAAVLEARARELGTFGVLGGRVCYEADSDLIQTDGGRVSRWTGVCSLFNNRQPASTTPLPDKEALDFISGAHMFVSKDFVRQAGEMPEAYFLYYEETDWCLQHGDLTLEMVPGAEVYHVGGATIGSKTTTQSISPLSAYFLARSRMLFMRKFYPLGLPVSFAYTAAKGLKLLASGERPAAIATLRGILGLPPSAELRAKIGPKAVL